MFGIFCFPESPSAFEPALALPSGSFLAIKGDAINLRVWCTWVFKCYLCELREVSRAAWDLGKRCIVPSSWGVVSRNEAIRKGVRQRHCPLNKHKMLGFEHRCPQKNPGHRDKMHRFRRQPRVGAQQVKSKEFKIFEPPVTDLFITVWEWNEIVHMRQHAVHGMQSSAEVGLSWRVYVRTYKVSSIGGMLAHSTLPQLSVDESIYESRMYYRCISGAHAYTSCWVHAESMNQVSPLPKSTSPRRVLRARERSWTSRI